MTRILPDDAAHALATRAIHAGQVDDPLAGAVMTPIYQTSTYRQEGLGRHKGYEYARTQNPTREALERNVAALEGGTQGFAFGSGLAALDAILKLFKAGDHVVCGENVYGGSHPPMNRGVVAFGPGGTFVDTRGATPVFQRPIEFGADIVLHSTTKYLNGHSDMVGGLLVTSRDDVAERLGFLQNASGAVPGPMDCWLALRGTKTLPLRMRQQDCNGRRIAEWLSGRKEVKKLYYPGLASHPQHELAKRQMSGFGGMVAFDLGDVSLARRLVERVKVFQLAESLGGVESLIGHPASMTHASVPPALREKMGLTDSLVRLSVGIEDVDDLIADLEQAMDGRTT